MKRATYKSILTNDTANISTILYESVMRVKTKSGIYLASIINNIFRTEVKELVSPLLRVDINVR